MKKFIYTLGIILIGIIILILSLEYKYKDYKTSYDFVFSNFLIQKDSINTIYIGNSHTGVLKNMTSNNNKVINLSSQGLDLFKIYCTIKKYAPFTPNLKNIYIGLDYEMIGQNQTESGEEYIERQYYKYIDTLYHYDFANKLMSNSNFFRSNRDLKYFFKNNNSDDAKIKANTFIPVESKKKNFNEKDCRKRALEHSSYKFKKQFINENLNYVSSIIELCKQYNINLVLFNFPKTNCYQKNIENTNINLAKYKIDSFISSTNIMYYDFYNSTIFNDDDFTDYDHLNYEGANKIIIYLDSLSNNQ